MEGGRGVGENERGGMKEKRWREKGERDIREQRWREEEGGGRRRGDMREMRGREGEGDGEMREQRWREREKGRGDGEREKGGGRCWLCRATMPPAECASCLESSRSQGTYGSSTEFSSHRQTLVFRNDALSPCWKQFAPQ